MESYLEIELVRGEPSKIRVRASNGFYSGFTEQYINADSLTQLSQELACFPQDSDTVAVFESSPNKGEDSDLYLKFFTKEQLRFTAVKICIKAGLYSKGNPDEAKFEMQYELAALDRFATTLKTNLKKGHSFSKLVGIKNA